jgi:hypothetical protein
MEAERITERVLDHQHLVGLAGSDHLTPAPEASAPERNYDTPQLNLTDSRMTNAALVILGAFRAP